MGLMDRQYMREGSYPRREPREGSSYPRPDQGFETEEHIRDQALLQATLSGFRVSSQPLGPEGFMPAIKGNYAIDLAGIGGQHRIWHRGTDGLKVVTSRPTVEESIDWVEGQISEGK